MAGGQTRNTDAAAVEEGQNIGIAGHSGDGAGGRVAARSTDLQVLDIVDDELGAVVPVAPEIVFTAENTVVRGGAEIEKLGVNDDCPVRTDGGEKLIRRMDDDAEGTVIQRGKQSVRKGAFRGNGEGLNSVY